MTTTNDNYESDAEVITAKMCEKGEIGFHDLNDRKQMEVYSKVVAVVCDGHET